MPGYMNELWGRIMAQTLWKLSVISTFCDCTPSLRSVLDWLHRGAAAWGNQSCFKSLFLISSFFYVTTPGFCVSGVPQSEKLHETEIHTLHAESELSNEEGRENGRALAAVNAQGFSHLVSTEPAQLASNFPERYSPQHNQRRRHIKRNTVFLSLVKLSVHINGHQHKSWGKDSRDAGEEWGAGEHRGTAPEKAWGLHWRPLIEKEQREKNSMGTIKKVWKTK